MLIWWLTLALLIALGILGIASWLKATKPDLAASLKPLEGIEGWVGVVGLVLGIWFLISWIMAMGTLLKYTPGHAILGLVQILVVIALSLILAMPLLRSFLSGAAASKIGDVAAKLAPFKVMLGAACLAFAVYQLIVRFA